METPETLAHLIRERLNGRRLVVVSNREPYVHRYHDGRIACDRPASGVTVALDPVMQAAGGVWVATASGAADRAVTGRDNSVEVPPEHPAYRLKRIWLSQQHERLYYYGFANCAIWPLCHVAYRRPIFRREHWEAYRQVNELFADQVAEEVGPAPAFVFIQDYHFALLPAMLKARCPRATIAHFWHIPWPDPGVFRICPWKEEIAAGMLGNDLLGFHLRRDCDNFVASVEQELETRTDRDENAVIYGGHATKVRAFPISVDFEAISRLAGSQQVERLMVEIRRKYGLGGNRILGIGADRIDYTKGIPERLEAIDHLLEAYPGYRGRLVFFQAGVPSRTEVPEYRRLNEEIEQRVAAINGKFGATSGGSTVTGGRAGWQPVIYERGHQSLPALLALYRLARFMVVSSLHDGLNMMAKEFVAAQVDGDGVLVLSQFAGASQELSDALITNPYYPEETAERIHQAIQMDSAEVKARLDRLRAQVHEHNIYRWAASIVRTLTKLPEPAELPARRVA